MASAEWKVLGDLVEYVLEQDGKVSSEKFQGFYSKHPTYKAAIKNMRTFCEQHADVFSISDTKPHWQLMVKIPNANATTKKLAAYIGDRGGTVALGDLEVWKRENPTAARTIHKGGRSIKDFFDGCACAQRLLTVESTSGIVTKVSLKAAEGPPMVGPVGSTDDRTRAAVNLALYLRGNGGSLLAPQIHRYYAQFPKHKQVIGKLKKFCEEHGDFLVYENDPHPGKISLPRRPESKPDRILAGPCHAFRSKPPPAPTEMTLESADPVVCIAASLAMFVRSQGGSIPGSNMSEYYKIHPSHKQVISDAGLRAFCERYDGLFLFEPLPGSGKLSLRSFCCHYLRGECIHATDHDGKLHSMPASSPVVCSFGTKCIKGHWKRLEDLAKRSLGAVTSPAFSTTKLNVAEIRWTHDAIRVTFRDGKLLMETLVDLLTGKLRPSDLPMVEVLELGGSFYAIEGNRRLWIFKELQAITGEALTIEVQSRKLDVKGFTQSFTSKNGGQSVEFYTKSRERTYPSMSFALAVFFGRVPSELEMSIGREVAKAPAGMMNVEALAAALSLEIGPGLESQLRQRPDLFQLTRGEVSLADCMTSFGVLAAHAAPNDQPPADKHEEADAAQEKLQMPELIAGEGRHWDESLREILEAREGSVPLSELSETVKMSQETLLFLLKQSEQFHIAWLESDYLVSLADCPGATGFQQPHRVDIASNADDSTIEAPSLEEELSHLLRAKGGSIPLGEMEWEEVCMTHFKNLQELASFLESRPRRFSVRWEGTQQVVEDVLRTSEAATSEVVPPQQPPEPEPPPTPAASLPGTSKIDGPDVSEAPPGLEVWEILARRPGSEPMESVTKPLGIHCRWGRVTAEPDIGAACQPHDLRGLEKLASLLPASLFTSTSTAQAAELLREAKAQRILLKVGGPMKVALRSGWLEQSQLPQSFLSQKALEDLAARLGWKAPELPAGPVPVAGTLHRVSFGLSATRQPCLATIHIGRSLLVSSAIAREVLSTGSVSFVGPTSSGKTTILRAAAAALSMQEQVLVVDFRSELVGVAVDACEIGLEHAAYLVPPPGAEEEEDAIQRAIEDHAPEVVVAEFTLPTSALRAAQRCTEAGVRLVCSLRCTMQALACCLDEGACEDFPFASLAELSRNQLGTWRVYRAAAAALGAMTAETAPCTPEILEDVMT